MDHGHTLMERAHTELDDWLEQENLKGALALVGVMWDRHPSWGSDPDSAAYLDNRWSWHQNLGELLNFHGSVHVRNQNVNGVPKKRLVATLVHADQARLEAVKVVAGGSIDVHAGTTELRLKDRGAFLLIKCGRLFIDRENTPLLDVLAAAQRFYAHVPEPGAAATDAQLAGQVVEEEHLIPLLALYRAAGRLPHDCSERTLASGGGPRLDPISVF